jgi:hypothetical protein
LVLIETDPQTGTEVIKYFPGRIDKDEWILQAKDLVLFTGKKTKLFRESTIEKEENVTTG